MPPSLPTIVLAILLPVHSEARAQCEPVAAVRTTSDHPTPVEVLVGIGPGPTEQSLPAHSTAVLESAFAEVVRTSGAQSAGAAVIVPDRGRWSTTHNTRPHQVFSVGSIGKTATAALILDDVARGRVSLADPVSRWFPRLRSAEQTTIDHLLTHHSGYEGFDAFPPLMGRLPPEKPSFLVRFAVRRSEEACPRSELRSSNTNDVLLGLVLEEEHGHLLHDLFTERVLSPLGLYRSRAMQRAMPPPELLTGHDPDGRPVRSVDYGAPHGAGNLAMTPRELATFWHALLSGQIAPPEQVDRMLDDWSRMPTPEGTPTMYYGRGVMLMEAPDGDGWLVGQVGGIRGFSAMVAWSTRLDAILAVTLSGSDAPEFAFWSMHTALEAALSTPAESP